MSQIKVAIVPVTPFQQNCSILICQATNKAAVVDPGGDVPLILRAIEQTGAKVEKILLTHGHADHAGGAAELREAFGAPIEGPHIGDKFLLDSLEASSARFGFASRNVTPDRWLSEGDTMTFGEATFDVLHCPGHTPGSVVFINRADAVLPGRRRAVREIRSAAPTCRAANRDADAFDRRQADDPRRQHDLHQRPRPDQHDRRRKIA